MFRLYGPDNNLIIKDPNELKIVYKLGNSIGIYDDIKYIIIETLPNGDNITNVILNYDDYLGYKYSVYNKKSSCDLEKSLRECRIEDMEFKRLRKIKKYDRM